MTTSNSNSGTLAVPSWVNTLSTGSIAADMAAADVNGTVTYAGLEKVFADLDATLASSHTSLTSAELSDLKTIAANLNNGMVTSSYLVWITSALVNGNAANATWTAGAASSTRLGNLAAGSSATQLSELIGKWFLGTDLPSSYVTMSGYSPFSVSYSSSSQPLFSSSGPSMNDINQGYLGDCYLLSSLAEVAKQNSGIISSMFTANGNNTYGVRFYVNGVAEYVTVNTSLADGGTIFNQASDIWASLAEKAYAQLQASGVVTGNSVNYGNSWSTIGNGGYAGAALEEITGASAITDFIASGNSWETVVYNSSLQETKFSSGSSTASILNILVSDLSNGDDLVLGSNTNAQDSSGRTTLVADHALSIYGYDSATGMLEIRNPWGTENGQTWDTTFEVSLSTLLSDGDAITADNAGGSVPVNTGPVLTVANLTATRGQTFAASNLFIYSDPTGSAATQYDFWDTGTGGAHFVLNGTALAANQDNFITAAQLSLLIYQSGFGTDTLWIRASDSTMWGAWSNQFTVTGPSDPGPVETVANIVATRGQSFAAASLFTYSDPIGNAATQYDFWDSGTGGGHFVLNGTALAANQDNIITAAQLSQVTYQSGSGADTLWVRANDGVVWGAWSNSFTVTAPTNTGPVATVANVTATHGQSFTAASLFTYSDPVGSAATQYDFWDSGTGGGHFVLNGTALAANHDNIITAAQLSQLTYQSGSGADMLWVRANDGTMWGAWSNGFTVTAPIDTGPVETVAKVTASHGQSFAAASLFTYSDPLGSAATQYDFWDSGTGGGHFVLNGTVLAANQDNIITVAQLSQLTYQSGSGADTLWVRANDGTVWGAWSNAFTVTAPLDSGPVVTAKQATTVSVQGQTFAGANLFTYSDPFSSPATAYDVWNTGGGGGEFLLNGTALRANQDNVITAAQLSQLTYRVGSGTDMLWVKANDGTVWGAWSSGFTISDPPTVGNGETLELPSAFAGELGFAGPTGTLQLDQSSSFTGTLSGFDGQDRIDLADIGFGNQTSLAYQAGSVAGGGTLDVGNGLGDASLSLLGQYTAASFALGSDGHGGTLVTLAAPQPTDLHAHA